MSSENGQEMELFQFGDILKNEIVNTLDSKIVVLLVLCSFSRITVVIKYILIDLGQKLHQLYVRTFYPTGMQRQSSDMIEVSFYYTLWFRFVLKIASLQQRQCEM